MLDTACDVLQHGLWKSVCREATLTVMQMGCGTGPACAVWTLDFWNDKCLDAVWFDTAWVEKQRSYWDSMNMNYVDQCSVCRLRMISGSYSVSQGVDMRNYLSGGWNVRRMSTILQYNDG